MKIVTDFDPSSAAHCLRWAAVEAETHGIGAPIGWGGTEQEAIADLIAQIKERDAYDVANNYEPGTCNPRRQSSPA